MSNPVNISDAPGKSVESLSLKKKRLSINPFQSILSETSQPTLDITASTPRTPNEKVMGNIDDMIAAASNAGKRYSYLLQDASLNNLRVLKPLITTDDKRASGSVVATVSALPSATSENPPRQSFNPGRRVSTFLNIGVDGSLGVPNTVASKRTSTITNSSGPSDSDSVGLGPALSTSNTGTTTRPSMRTFRKSTFVLQKMTEAGISISMTGDPDNMLAEEGRNSQFSGSSSNRPSVRASSSSNMLKDKDAVIRKDQGSVFVNALQSLESAAPRPDFAAAAENNSRVIVHELSTAPSVPTPPPYVAGTSESVDYTHLFPVDIGQNEGINVFRIEQMKPILLDPSEHGYFCIADCYIIMKSVPKTAGRNNGDLSHSFFTWIGVEAETDKRFCCAMYAVALRNLMHADTRIVREIPGDESAALVDVFMQPDGSSGIQLLDASHGTETGLFSANAKQYPIKLYRIDQKGAIPMFLVEKKADRLNSNHVYLLDAGMEIYQWNGLNSTLQNKSKARMIAARINKQERVGKADFDEFDEGEESAGFWEALEFRDEGEDDERLDDDDFPLSSALECLQLYRVFPKMAPELESHIVATGKIKKELLVTDGIYILDAGTELSLWIGKKSWNELRDAATTFLRAVAANRTRPSWISVNKYAEGAEPESFKLQFCDWQEKAPTLPSKLAFTKEQSPSNVDAVLSPYTLYPVDSIDCEDTMEIVNSFLETFSSFVYYRGKFIALPEEERGHFFEQDAYVFLCVYKATESQLATVLDFPLNSFDIPDLKLDESGIDGSVLSSETDDTVTLSCVIYFCQSRKTSKVPYSNFKLTTQKEMQDLVKGMYKCPLEVKLVEYGMEPFALLAHLENSYILHSGSRVDRLKDQKTREGQRLYQIRTDARYQTTRTVQVDALTSPLISRDCFFFMNVINSEEEKGAAAHILWRGDDFDETLIEFPIEQVKKILELYRVGGNDDCDEKKDHEGSSSRDHHELETLSLPTSVRLIEKENKMPHPFRKLDIIIPMIRIPYEPPKLFFCSCVHGFFKVERYGHFTQKTLSAESCIMLDPGSDYPLYVWIGSQCSETIRKLVRKSAMIWLNNCQDGRRFIVNSGSSSVEDSALSSLSSQQIMRMVESDYSIRFLEQGSEPDEFKAYFCAWDADLFRVEEPGNLFTRSQGGMKGWQVTTPKSPK